MKFTIYTYIYIYTTYTIYNSGSQLQLPLFDVYIEEIWLAERENELRYYDEHCI